MPGTTPQGFPYAEPTDPLVQWPATSQSLAEKLEQLPVIMGGHFSGETDDSGNLQIDVGRIVTWAVVTARDPSAGGYRAAVVSVVGGVIVVNVRQPDGQPYVGSTAYVYYVAGP
jgi:hypothetical protein